MSASHIETAITMHMAAIDNGILHQEAAGSMLFQRRLSVLAICRRLNGCEPVTLCPPPLLCWCNNTTAFVPTIVSSHLCTTPAFTPAKIVRARKARQRLASASTNRVRRSPPERRSPLMLEAQTLVHKNADTQKAISPLQCQSMLLSNSAQTAA